MSEQLTFESRAAFRTWLAENYLTSGGVWLLFGKAGGPKTLTANDALEEALYFGWIDGQMQSIDANTYKKYFSQRRENSKWSEKNKALTTKLEQQGIMTDHGREKIAEAKTNEGREKRLLWMVERLNKNLKAHVTAPCHHTAHKVMSIGGRTDRISTYGRRFEDGLDNRNPAGARLH